jgi:hypothetical protein
MSGEIVVAAAAVLQAAATVGLLVVTWRYVRHTAALVQLGALQQEEERRREHKKTSALSARIAGTAHGLLGMLPDSPEATVSLSGLKGSLGLFQNETSLLVREASGFGGVLSDRCSKVVAEPENLRSTLTQPSCRAHDVRKAALEYRHSLQAVLEATTGRISE